nr:sarcosine oxidase subunit alpha family protein [uncultured Rhodopila sp.]
MTQPFRTAAGGRIDRQRPVRFSFDGRALEGCAGDTLASALLANDVHLVGRSFKYHRPRGILSAGSEEPNALVTVDRGLGRVTPNLRATQIELHEGLTAISQNRFPSLRFDLGAVAGAAAPLLPPGFVYKTFMRPASFWKRLYEPAVRHAAGLGRAPGQGDPDRYAHQYAHCDVLIIGGGAAGIAAALGASATGARVILCDEQAEFGGSLLSEPGVTIDGWAAPDWVREAIASLGDQVTLLPRTTAFGAYPGNLIGLAQRLTDHLAQPAPGMPRERLWHVRAGRVILAAGAIERPLVFPGNDRPGIMLAAAARTYLHRYGVKVGSRAVVVTADDSAYRAASDLHAAGVAVAAVVDLRPEPVGPVVEAVRALDIPIHTGMTIGGAAGRRRVDAVRLADGQTIISCDTVLMSGGWTPSVHLLAQSRGEAWLSVGACAGAFGLATCLRDGTEAGGSQPGTFAVAGLPEMTPAALPLPALPHPKAFVDFQNDVTTKDIATATGEGFVSIEHVKRYTTAGMATDQGKTSNVNAIVAVAAQIGADPAAVGTTTFRPPYTPVTFGAFAGPSRGDLFAPIRMTPIFSADAVPEDAGGWRRARCYPRNGEAIEAATARECLAVRNDVGMADASTPGKIEIAGPDAALFLNRIYTGDFNSLEPGQCRYALLLGEDGFVRDDGIVARATGDRWHVTTTTGGAAFVLHHMEDHLQTGFAGLRVWLTSVTEQWAVIAVQGPRSIEALAPFIPDIELGAMPRMSVREGHIGDIPIRLFRAGFTGETGFEINLPPDSAQQVWDTLRQRDVTPYGTDAMHVLRAEKGFVIVGQETDGTVTPDDLGLGWTIGRDKGDFVGKRSLSLPELSRADRLQLVGLLPAEAAMVPEEGAQLTEAGQGPSVGHVTSSYHSPTLGRSFALALVAGGRSRVGARLRVPMASGPVEVVVTDPVFVPRPPERPFAPTSPLPLLPAVARPAPVARAAGSVRLAALAPATLLSVRAGPGAATAIGMAIGVLLPTVPCRSVIARERAALWLGPDEWLIQAPEGSTGLEALARRAPADRPASVVDVSQGFRALELAGPRAAWCLNGFCALDLDPRAFPVGMCTRTLLGKAEVVLWRIGAEVFHIDVPRSLLPYVWACLEEARLEFADESSAETPAVG